MNNFKMASLSSVSEIIMGQSPSSSTYNLDGKGLPFFQGKADFGEVYPVVRIYCDDPVRVAQKGNLLISVRAPIGAVNIAPYTCCIGRGLASIKAGRDIDSKYLFHAVRSKSQELQKLGTGSTFKAINKAVLNECMIFLPNMADQLLIAAQLDAVSDLLQLRNQQLTDLDLLVKSRFVEMFGMPSKDEKGWGLKKLGECCGLNPRKANDDRLVPGLEVSFVPMAAVSENGEMDLSEVRTYDDVKSGFTYFAEDDVLFAKITPCMENGKGAIAENLKNGVGFGSTEFHVLRPLEGLSNPYWLYAITSFESFRDDATANMTGSAGQRRVPARYLDSFMVSLPPLKLQNKFEGFVKQTDKSKSAIQQSITELETLKQALMQKYFGPQQTSAT